MSRIVSPGINTRHTTHAAALWLVTLALLLRCLVPAGYMPDLAALRGGRLALAICSAGMPGMSAESGRVGMQPFMLHPDAGMSMANAGGHTDGHAAHTADDSHHAGSMDCPFGQLVHHPFTGHTASAVPAFFATAVPLLAAITPHTLPAAGVRGPPLGPRAPPVFRPR